MKNYHFATWFHTITFAASTLGSLATLFWRRTSTTTANSTSSSSTATTTNSTGSATKSKLAVSIAHSFLLSSTLHTTAAVAHGAAAPGHYPHMLEWPLIAGCVALSLTAGLSVQHGKAAFLVSIMSHAVIFTQVPLSLELFLCWAIISDYTLASSFLLLQLRNMRLRVPKVVNSWRGLGVSLRKRETGYVAGLVVIELVRVANVFPLYVAFFARAYHLLGLAYMVWSTAVLSGYLVWKNRQTLLNIEHKNKLLTFMFNLKKQTKIYVG